MLQSGNQRVFSSSDVSEPNRDLETDPLIVARPSGELTVHSKCVQQPTTSGI